MIVRDDFSRFTGVFFPRSKEEKAACFSKYLAEIALRKVDVVRSDGGASFRKVLNEGNQARIYDSRFPPIQRCCSTPNRNHREAADLAARDQAAGKYPNEGFPRGESLGLSKLIGFVTH